DNTTTLAYGQNKTLHNVGELTSIGSTNYAETYSYDTVGRLSNKHILIDGTYNYDYDFGYNATSGFQESMTYPTSTSGVRLALQYVHNNGVWEKDKNGTRTYGKANTVTALGKVTRVAGANGVFTNRQYDGVTGFISNIQSGIGGGAALQNESYLFD